MSRLATELIEKGIHAESFLKGSKSIKLGRICEWQVSGGYKNPQSVRIAAEEVTAIVTLNRMHQALQSRAVGYEEPPSLEPSKREDPTAALRDAIRSAYEDTDPERALRRVAKVWESVDGVVQLAQARSRVLIGKLPAIELAEEPEWATSQIKDLSNDDSSLGPATKSAIASARFLVRYVVGTVRDVSPATIERGPLGRVSIDWNADAARLQWLVGPSEVPWPGVNVVTMARRGRGRTATRETRTMFNAFDVRDQFRSFFVHEPTE